MLETKGKKEQLLAEAQIFIIIMQFKLVFWPTKKSTVHNLQTAMLAASKIRRPITFAANALWLQQQQR